jgi:hypothetical protein
MSNNGEHRSEAEERSAMSNNGEHRSEAEERSDE